MASDPPKSRRRAILKAMREFFHTTPTSGLVKATSVARNGLETALRLLEKSADAFPPLKSAVGGLLACLDLFEVGYRLHFISVTISEVHFRQSSGIVKSTRN